MGRSNTATSSMISTENGPAYLPSFPSVHPPHVQSHIHPHHNPHSHNPSSTHQLPSSPSPLPHSHSQYLSVNHLSNGHVYEANNNLTPPARVYSPLSHGSNSSNGSALSYASNGSGGHGGNGNGAPIMIPEGMATNSKYEYEDYPHEPDGGPVKLETWKEHVAIFNIDQVGVMCDVLLQEGDMLRLVDLLSTIGKDFIGRSEKILRAQAHVAFNAALKDPRKFSQVYKILESNHFSSQYHCGLQKLWYQAHYKEAEITRGRGLGAVDKYRIRRKFQLPRTIWDGEETIYCFKEKSRNALRESFRREKYPNLEEKKRLSKENDLTITQVGNWFKNKRQREKEKEQNKGSKRAPKSNYNTNAAIAAMNPELLGMMLNPAAVSQSHHLHQIHHHHPHQQQQLAPLSPEDLESTLRKARMAAEPHLKSYMDEGMYTTASSSTSGSLSNLQPYLHGNGSNHTGGSRQMVLPGKSDITIGIVGSPGNQHHHHSPRSNNGLIITAVHSPSNNPIPAHHQHHSPNDQNPNGIINPATASPNGGSDMSGVNYGSGNRPRSNTSVSSGIRCGADLGSYHHSGGHHHHLYHHLHHHHGHPSVGSPIGVGYEGGLPPLIHNAGAPALSHA